MFSLKLLQSYSEDLLSEQYSESLRLITIKNNEHWEINNILNFRRYWDWIQYKVKWTNLDRNDEWYYVDKEKFNDLKKVLNKFQTIFKQIALNIEITINRSEQMNYIHANMNFQRKR